MSYLPVSNNYSYLTYREFCHQLILQMLTLDLFLVVLQQLHLLITAYWSRVVLQMKIYDYHNCKFGNRNRHTMCYTCAMCYMYDHRYFTYAMCNYLGSYIYMQLFSQLGSILF